MEKERVKDSSRSRMENGVDWWMIRGGQLELIKKEKGAVYRQHDRVTLIRLDVSRPSRELTASGWLRWSSGERKLRELLRCWRAYVDVDLNVDVCSICRPGRYRPSSTSSTALPWFTESLADTYSCVVCRPCTSVLFIEPDDVESLAGLCHSHARNFRLQSLNLASASLSSPVSVTTVKLTFHGSSFLVASS